MTEYPPFFLLIGGSDSSAGAGIQRDSMTIQRLGGHPLTVLTAITAQNHQHCDHVEFIRPETITQQMRVLLALYPIKAVKIGVLGTESTIRHIAPFLIPLAEAHIPIILDPVIQASTGYPFQDDKAQRTLVTTLFPSLHCITPNAHEAQSLTHTTIANERDAIESAHILRAQGVKNIIITGGDGYQGEDTNNEIIDDILLCEGEGEAIISRHKRIRSTAFYRHGTGCTFASALAFFVASGKDIRTSYRAARDVVTARLHKQW